MKVVWTKRALKNVDALAAWIAQDNPAAAQRAAESVLDAARKLGSYPFSGRPGRVPRTRELVVPRTPYVVAYRLQDDQVRIVAVLHGARRWPSQL